jgi:S1-C subfamily serine protease
MRAAVSGAVVVAALGAGALVVTRGDAAPPPPRLVLVAAGREVATGFVAGPGRVVTVAHVLGGGRLVRAGGAASVLRSDRRDDLAVLAAPRVRAAAPRRGAARAGEAVTVRVLRDGAARSLRATVRRTVTARLRPLSGPVQVRPALELAAGVEPGDSGAPVLDGDGRVVGMVFARANGAVRIAYALDARALGGVLRP